MPYIDSEKVDEKTRVKLEALIEKSYLGIWRKKRLFDIFLPLSHFAWLSSAMIIIAVVICIDDPSAGPIYLNKKEWDDMEKNFICINSVQCVLIQKHFYSS